MADIIGDKTYRHVQVLPSTVWTIDHKLDKNPSVYCVDSNGESIMGKRDNITKDLLTITFTVSVSGEANLN